MKLLISKSSLNYRNVISRLGGDGRAVAELHALHFEPRTLALQHLAAAKARSVLEIAIQDDIADPDIESSPIYRRFEVIDIIHFKPTSVIVSLLLDLTAATPQSDS